MPDAFNVFVTCTLVEANQFLKTKTIWGMPDSFRFTLQDGNCKEKNVFFA